MAYYKEGFYVRIFVKGIEGINNPAWVKIFCGKSITDQQVVADRYRKQKYEVEELPYQDKQKIREPKQKFNL